MSNIEENNKENEESQITDEQLDDQDDILGDSDRYTCTYEKGYISRQAVFSCLTCSKNNVPAFICIACCIDCHNGHKIIDLYTKRNLRCDCGNDKFPNKCQHVKDKDTSNLGNDYNHNYEGKYCTCDRPYPDPEIEEESSMMQCVVCEDWFHENHLEVESCPEAACELICKSCVNSHRFLLDYSNLYETHDVEVEDLSSIEVSPLKKLKISKSQEDITCKRQKSNETIPVSSLFFMIGWRIQLCDCEKCKLMYKTTHIPFITKEEDSIMNYENRGRLSRDDPNPLDTLTKGLDRYTKGEVMNGVNDLVNTIKDLITVNKNTENESAEVTKEQVDAAFKKLNKKFDDKRSNNFQ